MKEKYIFYLQLGRGNVYITTSPIYGDSLSMEYAMETSQRFYRKSLSGNLVFCGKDFDLINNADIETEFILTIDRTESDGSYTTYYEGHFFKTDCKFNLDDKSVSVKVSTKDGYTEILEGYEDEVDLIKLAPSQELVVLSRRPLLQMYVPTSNVISYQIGSTYWEDEVATDAVEDEKLLRNKYFFDLMSCMAEVIVNSTDNEQAGLYTGNLELFTNVQGKIVLRGILRKTGSSYYIEAYRHLEGALGNIACNLFFRNANGDELFYYVGKTAYANTAAEMISNGGATKMPIVFSVRPVFGRIVCGVDHIDGKETNPIPADDIAPSTKNYNRVIPYAVDSCIISSRLSDEPTEWGKNQDGKYFLPPRELVNREYYPINRTSWENASYWYYEKEGYENLERKASVSLGLKEGYPLSSCISVLLNNIAPKIKHEPTAEYSEFLYSEKNPVYGNHFDLVVTPKSNLLAGEKHTPALTAKTTLKTFLDMLQKVFACYWFVENGKLRIEHISWFKNGGSYKGKVHDINYDLTSLKNIHNGKNWEYGLSSYTYNLQEMPSRYEYKWMDSTTLPFNGYPIVVNSRFVDNRKKEEVNIGNFTADVDFMLTNPEAVTMDGFALFAANKIYNVNFVQIIEYMLGDVTHRIQNGYLSMFYLQSYFLTYDMPSYNINVNGKSVNAKGVMRAKEQIVNFPVGKEDPNPLSLIKTSLGDGEIRKISVNLSSRYAKITLRHDTK